MKSLLKSSRNKRKSVNEKPTKIVPKPASRSGSRLAARPLPETRNRLDSELAEPPFARPHAYQGLKPKPRENKASSYLDAPRQSMDSYEDEASIISDEEPLELPTEEPVFESTQPQKPAAITNSPALPRALSPEPEDLRPVALGQSKLSSQNYDHVVFKSGWLNKGSNMTLWSSLVGPDSWRLYRAELRGPYLNLYKPPAELGIKHFEPRMEHPPPSPAATVIEDRTERVRQPGGFPQNADIGYALEVFPHPDLQYDENESIQNGSLEAVCHTVLFNTMEDNRMLLQMIQVIPLFGDMKTAIGYFIQYAYVFMSVATMENYLARARTLKYPLQATLMARKNVIISEATDSIVTNRLGLVVSTIVELFPGMLMDQTLFERLLRLIELIGIHNDSLLRELTQKLINQQQRMTELLVFDAGTGAKAFAKEESKLSAEDFLKMDLQEFSDQINLVDLRFNREWNPKTDALLLYETGYLYLRYNPLVFDPLTNIHYLGRLFVLHLFEDEQLRMSIQFRAKVIQKWVELGLIFDKKGDMVSWLAIATVVCLVPILRLKKTWLVVDLKTLKIVSTEWGQVVFELDRRDMTSDAAHRLLYHVIAPQGIGESYSKYRVVPYFGDLAVKLGAQGATLKQCEKRVQRVKISFARWDDYLALVKEKTKFGEPPAPIPRLQKLLYNLMGAHVTLEALTQEAVLAYLIEIEPPTALLLHSFFESGDYERPPVLAGTYFPILFTDVLPNYHVFEKDALVQAGTKRSELGKVPAVTGVGVIDFSAAQSHQGLEPKTPLAEGVLDLLGIDNDIFRVGDDLIFKALLNLAAETEPDKPVIVNVVAKASLFEKLVDILVLTPNIFVARINEEDKQRYLQKHGLVGRAIKLDMEIGAYTQTFFALYKSFCLLPILLDSLGRRFMGAKGASISIKKYKDSALPGKVFPDWDSVVDADSAEINWKYVAQIEVGILEALHALILDYYADFTDDIETKQRFVEILKMIDQEIVNEWKGVLKQHLDGKDELYEYYQNLHNHYKKIRKYYIKRSYRPLDFLATPHTFSLVVDFPPEHAVIPTSSQFVEIQQLIDKLDVVVYDLFKQTTVAEWMIVADLFEMQLTRLLTGIFSYKQPLPAISEEDLKIFNVFSWLESLHVETPEVKLLLRFPLNIRALYGLHGKITLYFLNQLIEPRILLLKRRNRMTTVLQMLAIIRCRMDLCHVFGGNDKARIPAFLELCIAMAVCAPESRWFVNDWIYLSAKLHSKEVVMTWDTLADLIPLFDPKILSKDYRTPLTPCFGWLAERLLEVACYLPNACVENPLLLNFDKRRYALRLITSLRQLREAPVYSKEEIADILHKFEFLYNIKRSVYDLRDIREVARKENKDYLRTEQKNKLFQRLVETEFAKLKRDVAKREELESQEYKRKAKSKPKTEENSSAILERTAVPSNNMSISLLSLTQSFHSSMASSRSGGRFKLGGFLKSVRPFSINVGSSWSTPERVASVHELPDISSMESTHLLKPVATFDVFTFRPLMIHLSDIDGFFKVVSDADGLEHCLQAVSDAAAREWFDALNESRRYSYLSAQAKKRNGTKVFGVPIQIVCEREQNAVPHVVEKLLQEIELRGLNEVGLYRVPGAVANIQALKQRFDEQEEVFLDDLKFLEINTLAGCFKLYLRELPESLLTLALLPSFVAATQSDKVEEKVAELILQLPYHNYHLLRRLVFHLNLVTEHSDKNRMDALNLAMVFSMSFLSSADNDFARSLGSLQTILHMMIKEPSGFFRED